jgi:hypothetical protein
VAERVVLHVGLMKSGTSFLQEVLRTNQDVLREQGVLYPRPWKRQVQAVRDVIGHGDADQEPLAEDGPWRSLVAEIRDWPGTAVVSMEFLGPRGPSKSRQIVSELAPAQVDVVISVRDLARTIPAMWQESVQNRGTWTWEEYLAGVREENRTDPGPGRAFWFRQDAPGITGTWQGSAGRDHVTVLTVPPAGAPPAVLWERFASLLSIGDVEIDLAVRANPSLGLASLLVMREVNLRLETEGPSITGRQYERVVKHLLAKRGLAGRRGDPRLGYDTRWVVERGDRDVERLRALGPRVAGDLEDLRCRPIEGVAPEDVTVEQQLDAALAGLTEVVGRLAERGG